MVHITAELAAGVQTVCRKLSNNKKGGGGHTPLDSIMRVFRHQSINATDVEKILKRIPWITIKNQNKSGKHIRLNPVYKQDITDFVKPDITPEDAITILEELIKEK